jgi:hypothetical protein
MPETNTELPFFIEESYSQEDIEDLTALYNVLYSGFEVTKRSTKGQLQKRVLYCDKEMLSLSWKVPENERKRSSTVITMFGSKKSEDERLLDFQSIFGVMADPLNSTKVKISHPSRLLEIQTEDANISELLVNGLSVYAKNSLMQKRKASPQKTKSITFPGPNKPNVQREKSKSLYPNAKLSTTSSTSTSPNSSPSSINIENY